jgi:hypothetical protein
MARDAKFLSAKLERFVAVDCHALEATFRGATVADCAMLGAAIVPHRHRVPFAIGSGK